MNQKLFRKLYLPLTAFVMAAAGCSCSSTPSSVEIVPAPPSGSRFVGRVAGHAPLAGLAFQHISYEAAERSALRQAEKLGATHLVLDPGTGARFWGVSQTCKGNAYQMPHLRGR